MAETDYSVVFDVEYYQEKYADVLNGVEDIFEHFTKIGIEQGLQGCDKFNYAYYRDANPDIKGVFGDNKRAYYDHYINYGRFENRPVR